MNRLLTPAFALLIACAMPSCKSSKPDSDKTQGQGNTVAVNAEGVKPEQATPKSPVYEVAGSVMIRKSYCGGAAPSEEIMKNLATPQPAAAKVLMVRKGVENKPGDTPLMTIETDESGRFRMELPDGQYCIALQEKELQPDLKMLEGRKLTCDPGCFQDWAKRCDIQFEVNGGKVELPPIFLQMRCFNPYFSPCIRFTGPMPQ